MEETTPKDTVVVYVDERFPFSTELPENLRIHKVRTSLISRLQADMELSRRLTAQDIALYFGNLPPVRKSAGKTAVFIQNRYLVSYANLSGFPLRARARIWLERIWLRLFSGNASLFVVQTSSMRTALSQTCGIPGERILVAPFVGQNHSAKNPGKPAKAGRKTGKQMNFIYPASGESHKNHDRLIDAWCLLAAEGIIPRLFLTVGEARYAELAARGAHAQVDLVNLGAIQREELMNRLEQVDALVFPSGLESFGLPLIEARQAGLPIIAAELDYVRDVVAPDQTFDPSSALSVARAVKRFMNVDAGPAPVLNAREFVAKITKELTR